jgi:beta-phosphoglucomutase-like phosphatase (HAD superfamily)
VLVADSPAALRAARAAGMACLAFVGGGMPRPGGLRADAIFDDMRALPGLIAGLGAGPTRGWARGAARSRTRGWTRT